MSNFETPGCLVLHTVITSALGFLGPGGSHPCDVGPRLLTNAAKPLVTDIMSRSQFQSKRFILRHAWLNL